MIRKEDKAGIWFTVIIHLVAVIVLLSFGIGAQLLDENTFVLDFSRQDEIERREQKEQERQDAQDRVEKMLKRADKENPIKNIAVNTRLRDDRNSDAQTDKLYEDARKLADNLKAGYKSDIEEDAREETVDYSARSDKEERKIEYSGPSVLSWTLDGRKASHLPIPAYRCYGAGQVTVAISVDQQGNVLTAKVVENVSEDDECLRNFATRAARLSKFNRDMSAPFRQGGEITYSFVAQ